MECRGYNRTNCRWRRNHDDKDRKIAYTNENNFSTYSIELYQLLLASASEVDVIAKSICKFLDTKSHAENIFYYQKIIAVNLPEFVDEIIYKPRFNLTFRPWSNWKADIPPEWWTSYNGVKHHRGERFEEANLGNALNAMAGLLVSEFYYYKLKFKSQDIPIKENDDITILLPDNSEFLRLDDSYYPSYIQWG